MFVSTPWRIHAGWKMLQPQRDIICSATVSTSSFNVLASSSEDAASLEPTSPGCREDKFRHPCCDHTGECAFKGSVVARREVPVSMSSFCCSSHKQLEAPTSLEAMSTRETTQLLQSGVELNASISRLGDTLRGSSRAPIHCPRGQVLTHVANLNCPFAPSHGLFRGRVNARCLFILALSSFCGTNGFPLFCTSVGVHPGSSRLDFSFASGWQRVLRSRHRNRKMMTRSSSRCI